MGKKPSKRVEKSDLIGEMMFFEMVVEVYAKVTFYKAILKQMYKVNAS
jgi:hypothetical protein